MTEHLLTHISQVVGISRRPCPVAGGPACLRQAVVPVSAALTAPPAVNLRKFRRSIGFSLR
jgi:hypothetical protein